MLTKFSLLWVVLMMSACSRVPPPPAMIIAPTLEVAPDTASFVFVRWPLIQPGSFEDQHWSDTIQVQGLKGEIVVRGLVSVNACSELRAQVERSAESIRLRVWTERRGRMCVADETANGFLASIRHLTPGGYHMAVTVHGREWLDEEIHVH